MYQLNCLQRMGCKILKNAKLPNHIAFIMDGNRRHAKKQKKQATRGHFDGVQSLKKCLLMCCEIEIKMASFYCFSIQNFKRQERQVQTLMKLCKDTFQQLSQVSQILKKYEIKVNVVGNMSLVWEDVRKMFEQLQARTKDYSKMTINLCFSYDSLYQIEQSIDKLDICDYNYQNFMNNLSIKEEVDILVRTSNEYRLSNFMLPQCGNSYICILKQNWPQLSIYSFMKIILQYNLKYQEITQNKRKYRNQEKQKIYINKKQQEHEQWLQEMQSEEEKKFI